MDLQALARAVGQRIAPGAPAEAGWWLPVSLLMAAVVVTAPPLWRLTRPAVTIVHELGHAFVGILVGRRFAGFVVSSDMSGHAVTVGPRRGIGRVLTLWAGYPAPAILGASLVQLALRGWAGAALFAALTVLVVSLLFTRSVHTVLAVLAAAAATGALWWWGSPWLVTSLTLAAGAFLLLGAWRHLGAVLSSRRRTEDPAHLAQVTGIPAMLWSLSFMLVIVACTVWAGAALSALLP